jgi:hypothetical protein
VLFSCEFVDLISPTQVTMATMPNWTKGDIVVEKIPKNMFFSNWFVVMEQKNHVTHLIKAYDILFDKVNVGDTIK